MQLAQVKRQYWVWIAIGGAIAYPIVLILGIVLGGLLQGGTERRLRDQLVAAEAEVKRLNEVIGSQWQLEKVAADREPDVEYMLDRLREQVAGRPGWKIAGSAADWSTFTASELPDLSMETFFDVWRAWAAPRTAVTTEGNQVLKSAVEQAMNAATPGGTGVERRCESNGFRFVITACNGGPDGTFVRVAFIGTPEKP